MRIPRFLCIIAAALLVLLAEKDSCAQWKNVAPGLLVNSLKINGCLIYKDGIIGAGKDKIYLSADSGKTWSLRTSPMVNGEVITDMRFL
jgi:hypothetical protein